MRLVRHIAANGAARVMMTNLLDMERFPASCFGDLYHQRWDIEETFEPRYPIELAKGDGGYFGRPFSSSSTPRNFQKPASRRPSAPSYGLTYTIECPYCGKRFKRNSFDTKLNEHKDKYGNRCFGRIGYMV